GAADLLCALWREDVVNRYPQRKKARLEHLTHSEGISLLVSLFRKNVDVNRRSVGIRDPILLHPLRCVELLLLVEVRRARGWRKNLHDETRRAVDTASRDTIPPVRKDDQKIGLHDAGLGKNHIHRRVENKTQFPMLDLIHKRKLESLRYGLVVRGG